MLTYITRLYKQIKQLYTIKTYIDTIYKTCDQEELFTSFRSLKQLIFDSGSLYIKLFQWYISKLKSQIISNDTIEAPDTPIDILLQPDTTPDTTPDTKPDTKQKQKNNNIIKFIHYFEDIFEQCPYHTLKYTKQVFINYCIFYWYNF